LLNRKLIYRIMGFLLLVETAMLLGSAGVSFFYGEEDLQSFLFTSLFTVGFGVPLMVAGGKAEKQLSRRDGYVIVSLAWLLVSFFGMIPYYHSGYIPDITNAFFESMSGFTSTGSSILDDIEALPHGLLFWRCLTQWIGGLGIIFFTIAILPIFGIGGVQLFAAEASGPTHDKVHPRIGVTAKWIWSIYLGLTITLAVLLFTGGMGTFDSVCHAFSTAGTGGFSTKQNSIAFYNSSYIEYVTAIFMIISGFNFNMLLLFVNGKFRKFFQNAELKFYLSCITVFTLFIFFFLYWNSPFAPEEAFRNAFFQVASLQTSTGFYTSDYMTWMPMLWGALVLVMLIGGCAGSTTGGIKCIRMVILSKLCRNEFRHLLHPNAVLPVRINKQIIPPGVQSTVFTFAFIYIVLIILSTLIMLGFGVGFLESIGTVISSIGNMGPGLGLTGPAYSWNALPDAAKWLLSFLMLIGRLEIFTILLLFTPDFWKKN